MEECLVIAEAGVNHNGDIEIAKKMALVAKECGANIIKYQTFKAENLVTKTAKKADYQVNNMGTSESQLEMIKKMELSYDEFNQLKKYCDDIEIQFLSAAFDIESIGFLNDTIDMKMFKIPSGEINNYPYLVEIAKTKKEVILSTGMSTLNEIKDAVELLSKNGTPKITILHCNTEYPTPFEDVNLNVLQTLKQEFGCDVGYSDHTKGIIIPIAAVSLGAKVIEKHFTLSRKMKGPDHLASLEPSELKEMVEAIRTVELALGSNEKIVTNSEKKNISIARKSIVAKRKISKGELLTENNITTKRPGTGLSPMEWNKVINTTAIEDFDEDELIRI